MLNKVRDGAQWFVIWLVLTLLASFLLYQIYSAIMIGGVTLVESRFRPRYWSSYRLAWLARFMAFVLGTTWIFFVSLVESMMRRWHKREQLVPSSLRMMGWLVLASAVMFIFAQLVVFLP